MSKRKFYIRQLKAEHADYPDGCYKCQLFLECNSYKLPARPFHLGSSSKRVLLVCMNPGKTEDEHGSILIGKSGELLKQYVLQYFKEYEVYVTNAVKCYNGDVKIDIDHIRQCSEYLNTDIQTIKPEIIVAMGEVAEKACAHLGVKFIPTNHPAYVLRGNSDQKIVSSFIRVVNTLEGTLLEPPYEEVSDARVREILDSKFIGLDLEWNIQTNSIHTGSIASSDVTISFPINSSTLRILRDCLNNADCTVVGHNLKSDLQHLIKLGVNIRCKFEDTLILQRELANELKVANLQMFNHDYLMIADYWGDKSTADFSGSNLQVLKGCAGDSWSALKLREMFMTDFAEEYHSMSKAREIDMGMIYPVSIMELGGIKLEIENVVKHQTRLDNELLILERQFANEYGINPRSPAQCLDYFISNGVDIADTNENTLKEVQHPMATELLKYRELYTLNSRYMTSLLQLRDADDIIHPNINIALANTGRTSCSKPNMQNQPPETRDVFCSIFGKEGKLLSFDKNQTEYRCAAYLAKASKIIDGYIRGVDFHSWCKEFVGFKERRPAKNLNFARIFLATRAKLILMLIEGGLTREQAESIVDAYMQQTNEFATWQEEKIKKARIQGYIESPYGRRGYRLAPTEISNYDIQSFAGDINKADIIYLFHRFREEKLQSRIWLEVHDSTEIDCYIPEENKILEIVQELPMVVPDIYNYGINLPLPIEVKDNGRYWR